MKRVQANKRQNRRFRARFRANAREAVASDGGTARRRRLVGEAWDAHAATVRAHSGHAHGERTDYRGSA